MQNGSKVHRRTEIRITTSCKRLIVIDQLTEAGYKDNREDVYDFGSVKECLDRLSVLRHDLDCAYVDVATGYRITHSAPFVCDLCITEVNS
jgi:hypothetical protein